jgi:hypothetical protein
MAVPTPRGEASPAHVGGILGEKCRGHLGQALHRNIRNDEDEDQQREAGKGPQKRFYQALGEVGIESHGLIPIYFYMLIKIVIVCFANFSLPKTVLPTSAG